MTEYRDIESAIRGCRLAANELVKVDNALLEKDSLTGPARLLVGAIRESLDSLALLLDDWRDK